MKITKKQLRQIVRENMALRNMIQKSIEDNSDLYDEPDEREPRSRRRSDPITDADIIKGSFEGTTADKAELTDKLRKKIEKLIDRGYEKDIPSNWEEVLAVNDGDALFALSKVVFPGVFGTIMRTLFPANEGKTMKITRKQLRSIIQEVMAGSPTIGKPSAKGTDHLFTDTYGLGREDSIAGMNPQSDDKEYMRGYNEAQLDAGLPKVQPPSEPATAEKLDPSKLKGAFVSSKKDRSEMAEYIRKRNERMAKLRGLK